MSGTIVRYYAYTFGKPHYETPRLIVREIGNHKYYWNYATRKWTRLTKRCPLL